MDMHRCTRNKFVGRRGGARCGGARCRAEQLQYYPQSAAADAVVAGALRFELLQLILALQLSCVSAARGCIWQGQGQTHPKIPTITIPLATSASARSLLYRHPLNAAHRLGSCHERLGDAQAARVHCTVYGASCGGVSAAFAAPASSKR